MEKVKIKRNVLGDTRTADRVPTFAEFTASNREHTEDVEAMMKALSREIVTAGANHDKTKIVEPELSLFYRELCAKIEGKMDDFENGEWYPMHCKTERHHLKEHCPEDVTLIDVLEMICDCVCAGMARSGEVYPIEITSEILQKAVKNTTQMCIDSVEVVHE